MRVFIERFLFDLPPGGETNNWVQTPSGDDGEYDQFVQAVKDHNFDPPIPTVANPLCYTIKVRSITDSEIVCYKIGTYYGDDSCLAAAHEYVEFKYQFFPNLGPMHTTVITCDDSTHPTTIAQQTPGNFFVVEGYWLASDPDTFVSVA